MKLGLLDQVYVSPIQGVLLTYVVNKFANLYYTPSDGFSADDAHADGFGYDSALHSSISLMTPEYEPPAFDYSNGLCYIPPRTEANLYRHCEYPFCPPYTPYVGKGGTNNLECWPPLADESTPSMAHFAINAFQRTPIAVSASPDLILFINRGRYPHIYLFCKGVAENVWRYVLCIRQVHAGRSTPSKAYLAVNAAHGPYAAFHACHGSPNFIDYFSLQHHKRTTTFFEIKAESRLAWRRKLTLPKATLLYLLKR
eukprot:633562-Pleurochrysis_carterae.AAC.1